MQNKRIEITIILRTDSHSRMIVNFTKEVSKVESVPPTWQTGGMTLRQIHCQSSYVLLWFRLVYSERGKLVV